MGKRPQVSQPTISGAHTELIVHCSAGTAELGSTCRHETGLLWHQSSIGRAGRWLSHNPEKHCLYFYSRLWVLLLLLPHKVDGQREVWVRGRGHLGSWGTRGQSWGTRGQQWMNILGTDSFTPQAAIVHERVFHDLGNYVVLLKVLSTFSTKRERGRICTVKSKDQAKVNRII